MAPNASPSIWSREVAISSWARAQSSALSVLTAVLIDCWQQSMFAVKSRHAKPIENMNTRFRSIGMASDVEKRRFLAPLVVQPVFFALRKAPLKVFRRNPLAPFELLQLRSYPTLELFPFSGFCGCLDIGISLHTITTNHPYPC
jgi:hypothetical protein